MGEYLSWNEIAAASGNVVLNVVVALLLASALIVSFALFGRRYSLDQRVFPSVSARQRQLFGFLGFYLLLLSALEILNPPTLEFLTSESIAYRPSFLNDQISGLLLQDLLSIAVLATLLIVFVLRVRQLNRTMSRFPRQISEASSRTARSAFGRRTATLRFVYGFVAVSLLIAIIAPTLPSSAPKASGRSSSSGCS